MIWAVSSSIFLRVMPVQIREADSLYLPDLPPPPVPTEKPGTPAATAGKRGAASAAGPAAAAARSGLQLFGSKLDPANRDDISAAGYVGLRNLGCICYMNSLMQQLFMVEPFRCDGFKLTLDLCTFAVSYCGDYTG
jgi:hypothetical protein